MIKANEVICGDEPVDTPALLVDIAALEDNIYRWAALFAGRGIQLRPHVKTSKCLEVVERQVAAGACGLTVATLEEAELWADAGFDNLFQAYPVWAGSPAKARRIRDLHDRVTYIAGVESRDAAEQLARTVRGASHPLPVMIEIDSGQHRTGVKPRDVLAVAQAASDFGLHVTGVFTHGGHSYAGNSSVAADDEVRALAEAVDTLAVAGFHVEHVSAGSTPTAARSARHPVTEERPGTYVFGDAQQVGLGAFDLQDVALVVASTVVASHEDRFVLDAGSKILGVDRPVWSDSYGIVVEYPQAVIQSLSEHHAVVRASGEKPHVGDVVGVVPNHACVAVNLEDRLLVVADGVVVDKWRVAARGKNR